jgi:hypothetical protein
VRPGAAGATGSAAASLSLVARAPTIEADMRKPHAIAAIGVVLTLVGARSAASAELQAGAVLAMFGQCFGEADGRRTPLSLGDPVYVAETLDVAAGAKLRLRMNDGSIISIASGTRLTITNYRVGTGGESRDAILSLGAGLLRAVVSPVGGSPHFEVDTATGVAAVRSTDWFIQALPGSTQVGVLEGRVSLKSVATGREIVIPGHWGARVEAGRDPVPARVWTEAEFANFIRRTNLDAAPP